MLLETRHVLNWYFIFHKLLLVCCDFENWTISLFFSHTLYLFRSHVVHTCSAFNTFPGEHFRNKSKLSELSMNSGFTWIIWLLWIGNVTFVLHSKNVRIHNTSEDLRQCVYGISSLYCSLCRGLSTDIASLGMPYHSTDSTKAYIKVQTQ